MQAPRSPGRSPPRSRRGSRQDGEHAAVDHTAWVSGVAAAALEEEIPSVDGSRPAWIEADAAASEHGDEELDVSLWI
eukprot:tig00000254_g22466.t1